MSSRKRRAASQQVTASDNDDDGASSSSPYEISAACPYPESDSEESLETAERRAQAENPSPASDGGDDALLEPEVPVLHDVASARGARERVNLRAGNIASLLNAAQKNIDDACRELARMQRDANERGNS